MKNPVDGGIYDNGTCPKSGFWTLVIERKSSESIDLDFSVISEPKNSGAIPIRINAWINDDEFVYPEVPKVFVNVTKGSDVVIRCDVQATVSMDAGNTTRMSLRDDGSGADNDADDGTYSAYYTQFQVGTKRYEVKINVKGSEKARLKGNSSKQSSDPISIRIFSMDQFVIVTADSNERRPGSIPVGRFERTVTAGAFQVKEFDGLIDLIKPCPVRDLKVIAKGQSVIDGAMRKHMTLNFVAPGDDMFTGRASSYDLRCFNESYKERLNFYGGIKINSSNETVLSGALEPLEGGTIQYVTVLLPVELDSPDAHIPDVYFSIRATDKRGNVGDVGNFAIAHFDSDTEDEGSNVPYDEDPDYFSTMAIIGLVVGITAIGFLSTSLVCYRMKKNEKNK